MVVTSIQALLSAPNPDDPLAENVAKHWKSNEAEAVETGKQGHPFFQFMHALISLLCQINVVMHHHTIFGIIDAV